MNYDELPPRLKDAVNRKVAAIDGVPVPRTRRARRVADVPGHWRCATETCREEFTALAAVDRHVESTRHYRTEVVLDIRR